MAQKKVADAFKAELDRVKHQIPTLIGATHDILDVTFDLTHVGKQFAIGIKELVDPLVLDGSMGQEYADTIVSETYIKKIAKKTFDNIRRTKKVAGDRKTYRVPIFVAKNYGGPGSHTGAYLMRRSKGVDGITFRFVSIGKGAGTGANDTLIRGIVKALRDDIYSQWIKGVGVLFSKLPTRGSRADELTDATEIAHERSSTRGAIALQILRKASPPLVLDYGFTAFDVADQIQKNLGLDIDRNYKKNKIGNFEFRYLIDTSIKENFPGSEDSDFTKLKEKEIKKAVNDLFKKQFGRLGAFLFKLSGSKSPKQLVTEDTILDLAIPLTKKGRPDKRYKVTKKLTAKQFKRMSDRFTAVEGKTSKPKMGRGLAAVSGKQTRSRGKQKRADTTSLLKLEQLINKRLPAEVRRNMGRPALINQTGRFSNSVELASIRRTKQGLGGEYTYLLAPYQTFENEGPIRWPSGYNPKPLIAKSIRNLAMEYTQEKFTQLRRV